METTAIFAELVISGMLSLTWMWLAASAFLGRALWMKIGSEWLEAGVVVMAAYALGVVFDRLWDSILKHCGLHKRIEKDAKKIPLKDHDKQRFAIYRRDPAIAVKQIEYNRSRMRIARACTFNFVLIGAAGILFLSTIQCEGLESIDRVKGAVAAGLAGAILSGISYVAYVNLMMTNDRHLRALQDPSGEKRTE